MVSVVPGRRSLVTVVGPEFLNARLGQMTWDAVAQGGQIAYLRGLFLGMGWHR